MAGQEVDVDGTGSEGVMKDRIFPWVLGTMVAIAIALAAGWLWMDATNQAKVLSGELETVTNELLAAQALANVPKPNLENFCYGYAVGLARGIYYYTSALPEQEKIDEFASGCVAEEPEIPYESWRR